MKKNEITEEEYKRKESVRTIEMEINVGVDELLTEIFIVSKETFL